MVIGYCSFDDLKDACRYIVTEINPNIIGDEEKISFTAEKLYDMLPSYDMENDEKEILDFFNSLDLGDKLFP